MKFCEDTLSVLKNFSGINQSILFQDGNTLKTISPQKTVMASATIKESIPSKAAVYDLSRFLSTLSLMNDPDIDFQSDKFVIQNGRSKSKYTFAAENMIVTPPNKEIRLPSVDVSIKVSWDDIQSVIRAAGVLQVGDIAFTAADGKLYMSAKDSKNPSSDSYDVELSDYDGEAFDMCIKVENLKLMPADYEIELSRAGMSHFKSENVEYWIAVQSN